MYLGLDWVSSSFLLTCTPLTLLSPLPVLHADHAPNSTITGLSISNCNTALSIFYSPATSLSNSTFTAGQSGVYVAFSNDVSIANCVVTDMRSNYNAAIATVASNQFLLEDSIITNNTNSDEVAFFGGGLHLYFASGSKIRSCVFSYNAAPRGAAIITGDLSGDTEIEDCEFNENVATSNAGGAIYVVADSTLHVRDSTFVGNAAAQGGGAINAEGRTAVSVRDTTFWSNTAVNGNPPPTNNNYIHIFEYLSFHLIPFTGGGIEAGENSQVTIYNCTFEGNSATQHGGAFYSQSAVLHVNASVLRNNSAEGGGAAYLLRMHAELYGTQVEGNVAAHELGGGLFMESSNIVLSPMITAGITFPCNFSYNTAQIGGAICIISFILPFFLLFFQLMISLR